MKVSRFLFPGKSSNIAWTVEESQCHSQCLKGLYSPTRQQVFDSNRPHEGDKDSRRRQERQLNERPAIKCRITEVDVLIEIF